MVEAVAVGALVASVGSLVSSAQEARMQRRHAKSVQKAQEKQIAKENEAALQERKNQVDQQRMQLMGSLNGYALNHTSGRGVAGRIDEKSGRGTLG